MEFNRLPSVESAVSNAEVYTNLQGLQNIKNEKDRDQALKQVAQQFESLFVNMMTKSMRAANAVFEENSPFNSQETRFYRDMLDQQRALSLAHGRGLGIADAMYRQMSQNYGTETAEDSTLRSPGFIERSSTRLPGLDIKQNRIVAMNPSESADVGKEYDKASFAESPSDFVAKVLPYAKKAAEVLGVDHLILIAQSALETGWGKHVLSGNKGESSFNLFNIKKGGDWQANTVNHSTLEYSQGVFKKESAEFRAYANAEESFDDYVDFVSNNKRYQPALDASDDPGAFIRNLHEAGYATDPDYSKKVLSVYDRINALVAELPSIASESERKAP